MSHTPKTPTPSYTTATLPTDLPEGSVVFDSTEQKLVSFKDGSWNTIGAGIGSTTYVRDNVAGVIDQIRGDIPNNWKDADISLRGLVIGTSCKSIGDAAFINCSLIGSLVIPGNVASIGDFAFYGTSLGDLLDIENGVTSIGIQAFYSNYNIQKAIIPQSVTNIGDAAFGFCYSMTSIDCYTVNSVLNHDETLRFSAVTTIHVRSTDSTWTAGSGQTIGGKSNITVIKDL